MVGRTKELATLEDAWQRALEGTPHFFLLKGDPGIGKTRLATEIAARASDEGAAVAWGHCWEGGGAPAYWPWRQILRALLDEVSDEVATALGAAMRYVAQVAPEGGRLLAETAPILRASERSRFLMFDAVTMFLGEAARNKPLLVIIDDLHAADQA